jgi:hypothetical protein
MTECWLRIEIDDDYVFGLDIYPHKVRSVLWVYGEMRKADLSIYNKDWVLPIPSSCQEFRKHGRRLIKMLAFV